MLTFSVLRIPLVEFFCLLVFYLVGAITSDVWLKGDFNHQFQDILRNVTMSPEDEVNANQIVSDLNNTLNKRWPGTSVTKFGSMASGLALKYSDIDVFATIPGYNDTIVKALAMETLDLLAEEPELYTDCSVRLFAVPIITFSHQKAHMSCDLCLNKPSVIGLSYLFKYLMNLNPHVREVTIFVKFWSITHRIVSPHKLRSYAIYILALFYFQQKNMLPTLAEMQKNSKPIIMQGYDYGYNEIPFHSSKNESIYELLGGFFRYYREFDYDNFFISPYVGRPVSKRDFRNVTTIPTEFTLYKQMLGDRTTERLDTEPKLVIQDAFQHNFNVAKDLGSDVIYDEIISYFERAANIFDELRPENVLCEILKTNSDAEAPEGSDSSINKYCRPFA